MTIITPRRMAAIPTHIFNVSCSLKNRIPKNNAVKGSSAPRIAVLVEPMSFIAIFIVSIDIIVGMIASPIAQIHSIGLCIICNSVQNFRLNKYTSNPNNTT